MSFSFNSALTFARRLPSIPGGNIPEFSDLLYYAQDIQSLIPLRNSMHLIKNSRLLGNWNLPHPFLGSQPAPTDTPTAKTGVISQPSFWLATKFCIIGYRCQRGRKLQKAGKDTLRWDDCSLSYGYCVVNALHIKETRDFHTVFPFGP